MSVEMLEDAAAALGSLRGRVVFLGGATIGLWMTDAAARSPRVTYDVDVVAEVLTLAGYESSGLILDAIPAEPTGSVGGHSPAGQPVWTTLAARNCCDPSGPLVPSVRGRGWRR